MEHRYQKMLSHDQIDRFSCGYVSINMLLLYVGSFFQLTLVNFMVGLPLVFGLFLFALNATCLVLLQIQCAKLILKRVTSDVT